MATNSFSHLLPNLLVGLCKGAPSLRPYSTRFQQTLGYEVSSLEPRFRMVSGGQSNPDAILQSLKVQNTLLTEWTEAQNVDCKEAQLERYSKVTRTDLIDVRGLPPNAVATFDVVLVCHQTSASSFMEHLQNNGWAFPVLIFSAEESSYALRKVANVFSEPRTDEFFTDGIEVNRMPKRYLPFALDDVSEKTIVQFVVQQLLASAFQGSQNFTIDDFCSWYISVWNLIDAHKQREIKNVTRRLLAKLYSTSTGKKLLIRVGKSPTIWRLQDRSLIRPRIRSLRSELTQFIAQVRQEDQMEMDLFPDG